MYLTSRSFKALILAAAMAAPAVLAGCGDDDDDNGGNAGGSAGSNAAGGGGAGAGSGPGAGPPLGSGLPGGKPVEQLSADDAQKFCTAAKAYATTKLPPALTEKFACNVQAALSSPSDAECPAKVEDCLAQPPGENPFNPATITSDCESDLGERAGCTATVGELEACLVATFDQAAALFGSTTCEGLRANLQNGEDALGEPPTPDACKVIEQKCPQLLDDDAEE